MAHKSFFLSCLISKQIQVLQHKTFLFRSSRPSTRGTYSWTNLYPDLLYTTPTLNVFHQGNLSTSFTNINIDTDSPEFPLWGRVEGIRLHPTCAVRHTTSDKVQITLTSLNENGRVNHHPGPLSKLHQGTVFCKNRCSGPIFGKKRAFTRTPLIPVFDQSQHPVRVDLKQIIQTRHGFRQPLS